MRDTSKIWLIADTHFNHKNIIKYGIALSFIVLLQELERRKILKDNPTEDDIKQFYLDMDSMINSIKIPN